MRHPPGRGERGRGHLTTLFKNGQPVEDIWRPAPDDGFAPNGVPVILTLKQWSGAAGGADGPQPAARPSRSSPAKSLDPVLHDLGRFSLIALPFPKFADGRSFSKAKMLRDEHGFKGEIRAVGDVLWDQLQLMARCGFDAFEISHEPTLKALASGKKPFMSDFYQPGMGQETRTARRAPGRGGLWRAEPMATLWSSERSRLEAPAAELVGQARGERPAGQSRTQDRRASSTRTEPANAPVNTFGRGPA